jgi:predicted Zn-dependent protease
MKIFSVWFVFVLLTGALGYEAAGHANVHEMIEKLNSQIASNPQSAHLYLRRSQLHATHSDFQKAIADLKMAEKLDAHAAPYPLLHAEIHFKSGELDTSHRMLNDWLKSHPDDLDGWILYARVLGAQEHSKIAADAWKKGLSLHPNPTPDLVLEHMEAHLNCADSSAALLALDDGLAKLGPVSSLQQRAVELEVDQKRFDQALQRVNSMIHDPANPGGYCFMRARVLEAAGRSADAQKDWKAGLEWLERLPPKARELPLNVSLRKEATVALQKHKGLLTCPNVNHSKSEQ